MLIMLYNLIYEIYYIYHPRGELMADGLGRAEKISEKEKKKIARQMKEGYKKMAPLNRKLAEEYFTHIKGETNE